MATDVIMPALGMAQETGTLIKWLKEEGDSVARGEPLMLLETDKTTVEFESPGEGRLSNVAAQEGDEVPVGQIIAYLLGEGEEAPPLEPVSAQSNSTSDVASPEPAQTVRATSLARNIAKLEGVDLADVKTSGSKIRKNDVLDHISATRQNMEAGRRLASPKARRLAEERGLDISALAGSGPEGAILEKDLEGLDAPLATSPATIETPPTTRIWQIMAKRLTASWQTVPHFYLDYEADMTKMNAWHRDIRSRSETKVTITDLLTKLVAAALRRHPQVNGSWVDEQIAYNGQVNIGIAVALQEGLQVPVIHDADEKSIMEIADRRAAIVGAAKEGTLAFDDAANGTFTISNLGMFGAESFCAIVNPPQAAILAVGKSEDKVVVVDGDMVVQPRMKMTLSCDHRVVDGATGANFMQSLVAFIEDPMRMLD